MNWRISKAAAVLFLSCFFFSSCEDPTAIGLELQEPGTQIGVTYTDTATIKASTVLLNESILTLGAARVLTGRVQDGNFGVTTAKTFAEFGLSSLNVAFDPNNGADSLVLRLDYDYYFGDTTQAATWHVYRLTEGFSDQRTYFTTSALAYDESKPLGSLTFTPLPRSTYVTKDAKGDTLTRGNPYLINIKLNTPEGMALANEILAQSDKAPLKTQQAFVTSLLKGLAIVPSGSNNKAILGMIPLSNRTSLTLYYTSTTATENKNKSYTFFPTDRYFNQITTDRTGTTLSSLTNHRQALTHSQTNNLTYLQAGTGLVTKIDLPYLANFRKNTANQAVNLIVNRAELIVPLHSNAYADSVRLPSFVTLLEATTNGDISRTQGFPNAVYGETGQPAIMGLRGKEEGDEYIVNITTYVQNLLYNREENNGLILFPSNLNSNLATPIANGQTVNRAIIEANQTSANPADRRIRLKIYYSTPQ